MSAVQKEQAVERGSSTKNHLVLLSLEKADQTSRFSGFMKKAAQSFFQIFSKSDLDLDSWRRIEMRDETEVRRQISRAQIQRWY